MNQTGLPVEQLDAAPRLAKATDLPMLFRAERQYMREIESDQVEQWTNELDRNLELWTQNLSRARVADLLDVPTGIMLWTPSSDTSAVLVTIHVLPQARRRGIGTRLVEQFITDATAEGHSLLTLGVHEDNPIRGLYEQAGFRFTHAEGKYLFYEAVR